MDTLPGQGVFLFPDPVCAAHDVYERTEVDQKFIIQTLAAILTAIATSLGVTSCMSWL